MAEIVSTNELVRAFRSALGADVISHPSGTAEYDLYEVYLFGLAIQAAESVDLAVEFEDDKGESVSELVLRKSPSTIWSPAQPFGHATLIKDGVRRLEVHLGVYLRGVSGVSHEADVVIVEALEAGTARTRHVDPHHSKAVVVIEAKFHSSNVRLRTGREFLGLVSDFKKPIFVSCSPGPTVQRLLKSKRPGHFEVVPGTNQEIELRSEIARALRIYLA